MFDVSTGYQALDALAKSYYLANMYDYASIASSIMAMLAGTFFVLILFVLFSNNDDIVVISTCRRAIFILTTVVFLGSVVLTICIPNANNVKETAKMRYYIATGYQPPDLDKANVSLSDIRKSQRINDEKSKLTPATTGTVEK